MYIILARLIESVQSRLVITKQFVQPIYRSTYTHITIVTYEDIRELFESNQ